MTLASRFFLVTYSRSAGSASVEDVGTDPDVATERLRDIEHRIAGTGDEVVLLSALSLETLKRTHSSYFGGQLGSLIRTGAAPR